MTSIDAKLLGKLNGVYPRKVAYVVGSVFFETPNDERRNISYYEERIRELIRVGTLEVWGDPESGNPGWMRYTEIRLKIRR
jgi:hypothetical protein